MTARKRNAREERHEIMVDGESVTVTLKRIKNLHLRLRSSDGAIEVSAPYRADDAFIADFVRSRASWIHRQRQRMAASPLIAAENATPEQVGEWRAVVEACAPLLVEAWEPIMGVKAHKIVYRNMKSRWGSCQPSTGRICLNVRLALYPPECLEYVVVHELCHLLERGHGPRFKALMDAFLPDWRERRDKLR